MLFGGGQEFGLRPGTENVADAVGLAAAAKLVTRDLDSLGKRERHFVYFFFYIFLYISFRSLAFALFDLVMKSLSPKRQAVNSN